MKSITILVCSMLFTLVTGVILLKTEAIQFRAPGKEVKRVPVKAEETVSVPPSSRLSKVGNGVRLHVYKKALAFLEGNAGQYSPDIEEKFQEFLVHDLGLGEPEADRLMRMSFWKNYVTLQGSELSSVNATASDELQWEKRLKRAGFRAMGIPLLEPLKAGVQKGSTASKAGKEAMS